MAETIEKASGTAATCPMYNSDFSGYCQGCNQRLDCMLSSLLQKVHMLETRLSRGQAERS